MVYGICRVMLRDPHDAEDATQQAFLSAHRALLGGALVRDDGAWISTIARNECRARIGAAMRTPLPLADEDLAALEAPTDETERSMHADALCSALAELPERQREAVVLRYLYGLRYGEVATALGISRPATEALLFRARRAMRQRIRPAIATTLTVPFAVEEGLAQAIPGFGVGGSGTLFAGAAGSGILAKLTAGPVGVKVATAAVAVTTVGSVGAVESDQGRRDRAERPAVATTVGFGEDHQLADSDARDAGNGDDEGADDGRHGSGAGADESDDDSGPGSRSGRSSGDDRDPASDDDGGDGESSGPDATSGDRSGAGSSAEGGGGGAAVDESVEAPTSGGSGSGSGSGSAEVLEVGEPDSSGPGSSGTSGSDDAGTSGSSEGESGRSGSSGTGSEDDEPEG
jgi:RNA polymerase sigma factor (sigma-70 family)